MKPLITISIACWNVDKYIEDTLTSVLNQSYSNFEILCIDDCSTDNTFRLLEDFKRKDNRIRIIKNSRNMGLSYCRNLSIKEAKGDWLLMADGDDLINRNLIKDAICKALKNNADMVIWDYTEFTDVSLIDPEEEAKDGRLILDCKDKDALLNLMSFTWIRLIKLSILKRLGIEYPLGKTKQDIPAHWKEVLNIENIAILNKCYSYYRQRKDATSRKKGKSLLDWIDNLNIVERFLTDGNYSAKYLYNLYSKKLNAFLFIYRIIEPKYRHVLRTEYLNSQNGFLEYCQQNERRLSTFDRIVLRSLKNELIHKLLVDVLLKLSNLKKYLCSL